MRLIRAMLVLPLALSLFACGGGSSGGNAGSSDRPSNPPPVVSCPANQVPAGTVCQCPPGLIPGNDDYCTDPDATVLRGAEFLEPGFPIQVFTSAGTGFLPMYTKAVSIDADPELEILQKDIGTAYNAFNHDGTPLHGFPVDATTYRHGKMVFAQLDDDANLELFIGSEGTGQIDDLCELNAFNGDGSAVSGFPRNCGAANGSIKSPPIAVDFDRDGRDEVLFINHPPMVSRLTEDGQVGQFSPDYSGNPPSGRPNFCGLAAANLDLAGSTEVIAMTCPFSDPQVTQFSQMRIYVYDSTGAEVSGFPVQFRALGRHQPVIGDVDGDGLPEIVAATASGIVVISHDGTVQTEIERGHIQGYFGAINMPFLGLADVTGDGTPEILFYQSGIHAVSGNGNWIAGFPLNGQIYFAVGDVDGDNAQEIVTFQDVPAQLGNDSRADLAIYETDGTRNPIEVQLDQFSVDPGSIMPVIADIDGDGRSEVIVTGDLWDGSTRDYFKIWAFDFGGAATAILPEWGENFADPANSGAHATARD